MSDIDVSGCEYFYKLDKEGMCGIENARYEKCAENKSCEYKQIQRLKAESSELKTYLKKACKYYAPGNECALTGNNCYGTSKCIDKLKSENESYEYQLEKRIEICDIWMNLANKYKRCLDEIEEIAKGRCSKGTAYACTKIERIAKEVKE